jgi:hypothetical protein
LLEHIIWYMIDLKTYEKLHYIAQGNVILFSYGNKMDPQLVLPLCYNHICVHHLGIVEIHSVKLLLSHNWEYNTFQGLKTIMAPP